MISVEIYDNSGHLILKQLDNSWVEEDLSAQANGVNLIFVTTKQFIQNTLEIYHNGLRLTNGYDYNIVDAKTVNMVSAPLINDIIIFKFIPVG